MEVYIYMIQWYRRVGSHLIFLTPYNPTISYSYNALTFEYLSILFLITFTFDLLTCYMYLIRERLLIDPKEHPMLLAEPSFNSPQQRER